MSHFKKMKRTAIASIPAIALGAIMGFSAIGVTHPIGSANADAAATRPQHTVDFASLAEEQAAADELNVEIAGEGAVLLKNKDKALPLKTSEKSVTMFGGSTHTRAGGGAGGGKTHAGRAKEVDDSMTEAGFKMNPVIKGYYANGKNIQTADVSELGGLENSYTSYNGAAIVFIQRSGSEMSDIKIDYKSATRKHSLCLNEKETALINHIKTSKAFNKIILVLNTASYVEIPEYEDDDAIDGILWIGMTGETGIMALGKILSGEINPSGRTVDIWSAKFDTESTWFNVANNSHIDGNGLGMLVRKGTATDPYINGQAGFGGAGPNYASLDYEEGIYMGYRYYETLAAEGVYEELATGEVGSTGKNVYGLTKLADAAAYDAFNAKGEKATDDYYSRYNGVLYPFGYGLSYTNFSWTLAEGQTFAAITDANKNTEIEIKVTVTNDGNVAGKDVVQLYAEPEYHDGGIEKASKNLVAFAKTPLLQPGKSATVSLKFTPFELASFDDVDSNDNGFSGYELEAGTVKLHIGKNSHEDGIAETVDLTVNEAATADFTKAATKGANGVKWTNDPVTNHEIDNMFSKNINVASLTGSKTQYANTRRTGDIMQDPTAALKFMSRSDFKDTFVTAPTLKDVQFSDAAIALLDSQISYRPAQDAAGDPWYKTQVPTGWTQKLERKAGDVEAIQLDDLWNEPLGNDKWVAFMNQLTWEEMVNLVSSDGFNTPAVDAVGKPKEISADGATQLSNGTYWCNAIVIGSTYNVELAELQGIMVGNESLFQGVTGWYGPSMNTHRSAFSGRNFEYYSQDGVQAGLIAEAVIKGALSKGVVTYVKHYALNDQEQNRQINGGVITWCSEQAMREIYLRPFEYSFKAGANASMMSFNRIGIMPSVTFYDFCVNLTRDEWGMEELSITDMYAGGNNYWAGNLMVRCGTGPLGSYATKNLIEGKWDGSKVVVASAASSKAYSDAIVAEMTAKKEQSALPSNATKEQKDAAAAKVKTAGEAVTAALKALDYDNGVASPTTWFAVRDTAMRVMYMDLHSNLMANGNRVPLTRYFGEGTQPAVAGGWGSSGQPAVYKEIELTLGTKMDDYDIQLTAEQLKKLAPTSYTVTTKDGKETVTFKGTYSQTGTLPAGLSYRNGVVSGTPTKAGQYVVTFNATVDKYLTVPKLVRFTVKEAGEPAKTEMQILQETVEKLSADLTELTGKVTTLTTTESSDKAALEAEIKKLTDEIAAVKKAQEESGCGGAFGAGSAIAIVASCMLAFGAVTLFRKKRSAK